MRGRDFLARFIAGMRKAMPQVQVQQVTVHGWVGSDLELARKIQAAIIEHGVLNPPPWPRRDDDEPPEPCGAPVR